MDKKGKGVIDEAQAHLTGRMKAMSVVIENVGMQRVSEERLRVQF